MFEETKVPGLDRHSSENDWLVVTGFVFIQGNRQLANISNGKINTRVSYQGGSERNEFQGYPRGPMDDQLLRIMGAITKDLSSGHDGQDGMPDRSPVEVKDEIAQHRRGEEDIGWNIVLGLT